MLQMITLYFQMEKNKKKKDSVEVRSAATNGDIIFLAAVSRPSRCGVAMATSTLKLPSEYCLLALSIASSV